MTCSNEYLNLQIEEWEAKVAKHMHRETSWSEDGE